LLLPLIGAFAYVTLTSSNNGYSQNRTGSHASTVGCGSCHGSSVTSGITVAVELDSAGVPVTHYRPGMSYTVKVTGTNTTSNTLPKFGMELSLVKGSGATDATAGTFSSVPSGYRTMTGTGSITYLSHSTPNSPATGTGASGTTYVTTVNWTAPAAGTGTVTAWALINAVNGDSRDNSSDKWNTDSASFQEWPSSTGVANVATVTPSVYPNPVLNELTLSGFTGNYQVIEMSGKMVTAGTANGATTINTADWANGVYFVTFNNSQTIKIVKN